MIRAIALDDEPIALDVVKSHAAKVPFLDLKESFTHALKAIDYLHEKPVDLIFLDIKMPDISGIELVNSLHTKPMIVFTTAYAEHALAGFELDAIDYLLKPFSFPRFLKACNKVHEILTLRQSSSGTKDYVFIKTGYEQVRVLFDELCFVEASGNYLNFVLTDGSQYLSRMTIAEGEALLPDDRFVRIHRSFIVAKDKVGRLERHQLHANGHILPIGEKYADQLTKNWVIFTSS